MFLLSVNEQKKNKQKIRENNLTNKLQQLIIKNTKYIVLKAD